MSDWDQAVVLAALAVLLVSLALSRRQICRRPMALAEHWPELMLLVASLIVRFAMPGAFIHSNLHGYDIAGCIENFPEPLTRWAYYGHGSFVTLGLIAPLFGGGWGGTLTANTLMSVATLWLLWRLVRNNVSRPAGIAVLALGAAYPAFVRIAVSEDAHTVGSFYMVLAWFLAYRLREHRAPPLPLLAACAAASLLACYSRQPCMIVLPTTILIALPKTEWLSWLRRRAVLVTLVLVTVALTPRILLTVSDTGTTFRGLGILFSLATDWSFWTRHPYLRLDESFAMLPVVAIGLVTVWRHGWALGVALTVGWLASLIASLGFSFHPSYFEEYAVRLPTFYLGLFLAGHGAGALYQRLRPHIASPTVWAAVTLAALSAPAFGLIRVANDRDPQAQELSIVTNAAAERPPHRAFAPRFNLGYPPVEYDLPRLGFVAAGWDTAEGHQERVLPEVRFQGIGCYAFGPFELFRLPDVNTLLDRLAQMPPADLAAFCKEIWDAPEAAIRRMGGVPPAPGPRPECAARPGEMFEHWGDVMVDRQQLIHVYFSQSRIPIGVWRQASP